MDAEVLRLYSLAPRLERQILDTFAGSERPGVPFKMDRYFPDGFEPFIPLHEYLSEEFRDASAERLVRLARTDPPSPSVLAVLKAAEQARGG